MRESVAFMVSVLIEAEVSAQVGAALRPNLSGLLPRQGVAPAFRSWAALADSRPGPATCRASCGGRSGPTTSSARLRSASPTRRRPCRRPRASVAVATGLVAWLAERHGAGEPLPVHDTVRIAESRWRAMRYGLTGTLLDLDTGEPEPACAV